MGLNPVRLMNGVSPLALAGCVAYGLDVLVICMWCNLSMVVVRAFNFFLMYVVGI